MIRLKCPNCEKQYAVDDSKAGKTGKCNTCGSSFQIPSAGTGIDPVAKSPSQQAIEVKSPLAPDIAINTNNGAGSTKIVSAIEIAPCPNCNLSLSVMSDFLNSEVECPGCKNQFIAIDKSQVTSNYSKRMATVAKIHSHIDQPEDNAPPSRKSSKRSRDEDRDEADCPFCGESVLARAKICKHCGETLDVSLRAAEEARRESRRRRNHSVNQNTNVIVHSGRRDDFNHTIHIVLDVLTCGSWLPIHLICWALR